MKYTTLGNTGLKVSRFGLGAMRFHEEIDKGIELIRYALDHGVNYLDTAYLYQNSEEIVGRALAGRVRDEVIICTKSPTWLINTQEDFERYLDEELKRLNTDYIDIYMLHNLFEKNYARVMALEPFVFLEDMVKKGKIRYTGFSLHGSKEDFKKCVDTWDKWNVALIQLNILDPERPTGVAGLKYGYEKGLGMTIMGPLRGGSILEFCPENVNTLLSNYRERRSLQEWCFRWLYDKPEVGVILSGATDRDHLVETINFFEEAECSVLTEDDNALIDRIRDAYYAIKTIDCSDCGYCMPCKSGVNIPEVFKRYNAYMTFGRSRLDRMNYIESYIHSGCGADQCTRCNECLDMCTQELDIPTLLQTVTDELGEPMKIFGM